MGLEVVMYTTPGCGKCAILGKKLSSKGVFFTTSEDVERLAEKGFHGLPVLDVNGKLLDFGAANRWINDWE